MEENPQPHIKVHRPENREYQLYSAGSESQNGTIVDEIGDYEFGEEERKSGVCLEKGVFIIEKGRASVINASDNYDVTELTRGDFFGEDSIFQERVGLDSNAKGYCHYGDVISNESDEALSCLFISAESM